MRMTSEQIQARDRVLASLEPRQAQHCVICGGNVFETLAVVDRFGLPVSTVVCRGCGLVQTNPRMSEEAYARFYQGSYRDLYGGREGLFEFQRRRGQALLEYLGGWSGGLVVEVGCGPGGILSVFKESGCRVVGLDIDADVVLEARGHGLDVYEGGLSSLVLREQPDIIVYSHVLEHIVDPVRELRLVSRFMKKESLLFVEVPGIKHLGRSYNQDLGLYLQFAHIHHFSLRSLCNLAGLAGLELVRGDERVRALFRLGVSGEVENDYKEVMDFLVWLKGERERRLNLFRMKNTLLSGMVCVSKRCGVYPLARRLYRCVGGHETSNFDR